jgi:hypothetical protein
MPDDLKPPQVVAEIGKNALRRSGAEALLKCV